MLFSCLCQSTRWLLMIFHFRIYERYLRDQRALRRLQCRKTHTAYLNETTRQRLLRDLKRERRHAVHEQICAHGYNAKAFT